MQVNKIIHGDCLKSLRELPDNSIDCCVTSPPYYGLRDYGDDGQIGLEETPEMFVEKLVEVFREVKRVLKNDGVMWLNLGDSYMSGGGPSRHQGYSDPKYKNGRNGNHVEPTSFKHPTIKPKDLIGIPWMVAFALRADGWYLRQDIIWSKPNPMPESVADRCTKSHEYIFLLSKSKQYYFDNLSIQEKATTVKNNPRQFGASEQKGTMRNDEGRIFEDNGFRNKRSVWAVTTKPFSGAHFATFPEDLIVDCIKAGCPENGVVLDPFGGAGTTALVARKLNRNYILCELNQEYIDIAQKRLSNELGMFI